MAKQKNSPAYGEIIAHLFSLRRFGMKPGLTGISALMKELGSPHQAYKTVHVAGSKGKGSVCHYLASILQAAGYRTGLYTSPHLVSFTERFRVNGEEISRDALARVAARVMRASQGARLPRGREITFFEFATAIAFEHFKEQKVDIAVIETGMGGRFDATNVCRPEIAIITGIELEHAEILGDSLEKIAFEKAGIIKPGCVVITAENKAGPLSVIERQCRRNRARLLRVGRDIGYGVITNTLEPAHNTEREIGAEGLRERIESSFSVSGSRGRHYESLCIIQPGIHQKANATAAVCAAEVLDGLGMKIPEKAIRDGLRNARLPCRFELVAGSPCIVLDIMHTPGSARALAGSVREAIGGKVTMVYGSSADKDIPAILREMAPVCSRVIATKSFSGRSAPARGVADAASRLLPQGAVAAAPDVPSALSMAQKAAGQNACILVTGSAFVCGEALAHLTGRKVDGLTDTVAAAGKARQPRECSLGNFRTIFSRLSKLFGPARGRGSELASQAQNDDPFRVLIATILSHRTKDENTHKATELLFAKYKTPGEIANAPVPALERLVHSTGFYHVKARNIKKAAKVVLERFGGRVPDTLEELLTIPAVGRKTANCVLVYAFGKPAIPVDTHVHRISNRLGWVKTKNPDDTEAVLTAKLPREYWLDINDYLVQFGKTICRPVGPKCPQCPLKGLCPSSTAGKAKGKNKVEQG